MTSQTMFITLNQRDDEVCLTVVGEIDRSTEPSWRESVIDACRSAEHSVTIDLDGVRFMDAAGLRILLGARDAAADHGVFIVLANVPHCVARLFEICGFEHHFDQSAAQPCPA